MDIEAMRAIVRRDLYDEDEAAYRWSNDALDGHIAHALKEFSEAIPSPAQATIGTEAGSRDLDISTLSDRVMVEAVEYPVGEVPKSYQPFAVWGDVLTLLDETVPDGSDATVYYGQLHTLDDTTSTIPARLEELVAAGAEGYAAAEMAAFAINRVNVSGDRAAPEFLQFGNQKLAHFRSELKRLGRRNRVRVRTLYRPVSRGISKSSDPGPG